LYVIEVNSHLCQMDMDAIREDYEGEDFASPRPSTAGSPEGFVAGLTIVALLGNNPVSRAAIQFLKGLSNRPHDRLILAYCAPNPYSAEGMDGVLETFVDPTYAGTMTTELFNKSDEETLLEAISNYIMAVNPDLVVIASKGLCNDTRAEEVVAAATARNGGRRDLAMHARPGIKPSRQSFGMKLCQTIRHHPLLVVKANTKGSFLTYTDPKLAPMKCVVDLQPTSRHMLSWLMKRLSNSKDVIHLVVNKAYDGAGATKQTAVRMMTSFAVQCSVNQFKAERHMFKEGGERVFPAFVTENDIDLLMIQAPRTKDLSPYCMDLLCNASTSLLLWPADTDNTALGQSTLPSGRDDSDTSSSRPSTASSFMRNLSLGSNYSGTGFSAAGSASFASSSSYRSRPMSAAVGAMGSRSLGSGSGSGGYSYHGTMPSLDGAAAAALKAMQDRQDRRRLTEDQAKAASNSKQNTRKGALSL